MWFGCLIAFEEMFDLDQGTLNSLLSLLGLLNPSEYFITVDHSVLWQRHIAWSKPRGEDLRQYVTQRYASNMVFLSCLLACMINVFFNSSDALTDMRSLLYLQSHGTLRYWIGVCIISNICVTIVALVSTFTLWGMVSSIRLVIVESIGLRFDDHKERDYLAQDFYSELQSHEIFLFLNQ